jgi:hypothetical protein
MYMNTSLVHAFSSIIDDDEAKEVVRHGCQSGCCGELIYYDDTTAFYKANKAALLEWVHSTAIECGEADACTMVARWCKRHGVDVTPNDVLLAISGEPAYDNEYIFNSVVWAAAEAYACNVAG